MQSRQYETKEKEKSTHLTALQAAATLSSPYSRYASRPLDPVAIAATIHLRVPASTQPQRGKGACMLFPDYSALSHFQSQGS
jgi:hypothetical protein